MALMLEYKPGMDLTQPWSFAPLRAQAAYQWGVDGVVRQVPANGLRDAHYINGVKTTLIENATNNSLLQSSHLNTAPWAGSNTTASEAVGLAPDGSFNACAIQDNAVNSTHYRNNGGITITAGENIAMSCYLKAGTHTKVLWYLVDTGTTTGVLCQVDLAAGTIVANVAGTGTTTLAPVIVPLANGWFWVAVTGKIDSGTLTSAFMFFYQVGGNNFATSSYVGDGSNCVFVWNCQMERYGVNVAGAATSPIPTTTGVIGRSADVMTLNGNWPYPAMPMWGYVKFIDLGWAQRADFSELMCWRDASSTSKGRMRMITGSGTAGTVPSHRINWSPGTGVAAANQNAAIVSGAPSPAWGASVELFWRWFADGSLELNRSIAGGAVTTVTNAGTPMADFANATAAPVLSMWSGATVGLISLKIGAGTSLVTTLAQAALA